MLIKGKKGPVRFWHTFVISALGKLRQEERSCGKLKASLCYLVRTFLKTQESDQSWVGPSKKQRGSGSGSGRVWGWGVGREVAGLHLSF